MYMYNTYYRYQGLCVCIVCWFLVSVSSVAPDGAFYFSKFHKSAINLSRGLALQAESERMGAGGRERAKRQDDLEVVVPLKS